MIQCCIFKDPEPRADEPLRYKTFDDAYGTTTTEKFCPSQTAMLFPTTDKPAVKMTGETVRDYVLCDDCGKPRYIVLIFSQTVNGLFHMNIYLKHTII